MGGSLGKFARSGWSDRANLQVMGALDARNHPVLANMSEIQENRNRDDRVHKMV